MNIKKLWHFFLSAVNPPPNISDALVWLDGVIIESGGSYYFRDRSGNGRHFLITNRDFDSSFVGLPYKTAATISAPVGDATLIAADINSFLYTAGTPNQISVVSLFQDVDYEHKMFAKHASPEVNGNNVQTYEPRVSQFVVYNSVRTGADLTACQTYFSVPTEATSNVTWITKAGNNTTGTGSKAQPWLTLIKADASATVNNTVYVKSGTYQEDVGGAFPYLATNKTLHYKFIGRCVVTSSSTALVIRLVAAANPTFDGAIIDGNNITAEPLGVFGVNAKVSTFNRCLIKGATTNLVGGTTAVENLTFTNCVFLGAADAVRTAQSVRITSPLVENCYFVNLTVIISATLDNTFRYNRFYDNDKSYCITLTTGVGFTALNNEFNYRENCINQSAVYVIPKTIDLRYNTFNQNSVTGGSGYVGIDLLTRGTIHMYFKNNTLYSPATSLISSAIFLRCSAAVGYISEYDDNSLISKAASGFFHLLVGGIDTKIRNNYSWSNSLSEIQIGLGAEGSADGSNSGSVITGNRLIGFKYENPTGTSSVHALFISGGVNVKIAYNRIGHTLLGIVVKTGLTAQPYTLEGVYGNLLEDVSTNIWARGVSALNIFNNTIKHSSVSYTQGFATGIIADENSAQGGTQNSANIIVKNNIIDVPASGTLVSFDTAASTTSLAEYNDINGGNVLLAYGVTNYTSLATAQAAGRLLNCVVQDPLLSSDLIPASPIIIGQDLGDTYDTGLDVTTTWGSSTTTPVIVTRDQQAVGDWEVGAFVQR